jgi:hypothetical protein
LPAVSLTPVANMPPVSTTPAAPVAKFAAGVFDIGGNFATGAIDTGGAPSLPNISANFRRTLMIFLGARGRMIHGKKPEAKNFVTLSLYKKKF